MSKIAYILLCHKDPAAIVAQATALSQAGDCVSIHFDASAPAKAWAQLQDGLKDVDGVALVERRIRCGWGEWSLVAATLAAIRLARERFDDVTHYYMLSGDCAAIKTAEYIHDYLDANDCDWIESFDFFDSNWIKTGMKEDRLIYRHYFNERSQPKRFYAAYNFQKRFGLTRAVPKGLRIMIGSQWWCLRAATIDRLLEFCDARPDVMRFFSTTWIPDETFFQTLVRHLVPEEELRTRTLTFLMFTDYGMPVVFYDDHHDMLLAQDFLFARKISGEARELRRRLSGLFLETGVQFRVSNEGRRLFQYLTTRGRVGLRAAPRVWENEASIGRDRTLYLIVCKKWHVAKRLLVRLREVSEIPTVEFLFNEASTPLPDLGGIERGLEKRMRHRRALIRMLFDYFEREQLVICLDSADFSLIEDFYKDRCETRLLEIGCRFSDDYLSGHAYRTRLAGPKTGPETMAQLMPTLRQDIRAESDRIFDARLANFHRIHEGEDTARIAATLAQFFQLGPEEGRFLSETPHLFDD